MERREGGRADVEWGMMMVGRGGEAGNQTGRGGKNVPSGEKVVVDES